MNLMHDDRKGEAVRTASPYAKSKKGLTTECRIRKYHISGALEKI